MKRSIVIIITAIILLMIIGFISMRGGEKQQEDIQISQTNKMEIKSVFNEGEKIPVKYTADGANINPPLEISEIPENTKTLVLIMEDPDAQKVVGYTWIHWIRFNILVDGTEFTIEENSAPGIGGYSTYKTGKYGGPSPPSGSGDHRYYFKVYAIDTELALNQDADKTDVLAAIEGHVLSEVQLMGVYGRG